MKLALTMLCENPLRKTGLSTLFHEFVSRSLRLCPEVSWILFAGPNQPWSVADARLELIRDFPANDRLNRRLLADHFQVCSRARAHGAQALITVGFVPARKCLPTVMHLFSLQHLDRNNRLGLPRELYRRWVMKYSWPNADLIITNSDFAMGQVLSVYPQFKDRLVRSYEGLNHDQYHSQTAPDEARQLQAELGLSPGYLLWVSNLYPYKQADLLLHAYALLSPQERERHPLAMTGSNWEGVLEAATALVRRLGIEQNVRFLGWIEEQWLAPLYRHALALCLASREETFGRTVIEAQACGTPCIVNDIPVMHEVTGGAAVIVNFQDRQATVQGLRRLIQDTALRQQLRQHGLANVRRFHFDTLTLERLDAIRRLVSWPPAPPKPSNQT